MSHVVKVKTEIRDLGALRAAVEALGGTWIGEGFHRIYGDQKARGQGFKLPGWAFPVVWSDGALQNDPYGAHRDKVSLDAWEQEYAMQRAEQYAREQGWMAEREGERLTIYHPDGGTIQVDGAMLETKGFKGEACEEASEGLLGFLGKAEEQVHTPERFHEDAQIQVAE